MATQPDPWAEFRGAPQGAPAAAPSGVVPGTRPAPQPTPPNPGAGYVMTGPNTAQPIVGGPEDPNAPQNRPDPDAERRRLWNARYQGRDSLDVIRNIRETLRNPVATGVPGYISSFIPGSGARDLRGDIDTIRARLAFDRLDEMRRNSTTGASGLGALSDSERNALASVVASLDPDQSPEKIMRDLDRVERHYKRFLLTLEGINPDDYQTDPFEMLPADEVRRRAQQMLRDGASQETVEQFLRLQDHQITNPEVVPDHVGRIDAQVQQGADTGAGIQLGAEHVGQRGAEAVQDIANTFGGNFSFADDWRNSIQERFGNRAVDPAGETLGRYAAAVPVGFLTRNPFIAGAATEALVSDNRDAQGLMGDAIRGGVSGVVGDRLIRGAGALLSPNLSPDVTALSQAGVRMTPGQLMGGAAREAENIRTSLPFAGSRVARAQNQSIEDFNRAAYDQALAPTRRTVPGDVPVGHEGVEAVRQQANQAYDAALDGTSFNWNTRLGQNILGRLGQRNLRPDVADEVANVVRTEVGGMFANGGRITGRQWKELDEQLGGIVEDFRRQGGPWRRGANAIRDMRATIRRDLGRQNPGADGAVQQADQAWRNRRVIAQAATRDGAEGVFTPSQLLNASRSQDAFGRTAFSEGRAPMQEFAAAGQRTLPQTFANSRTTDRAIAAAPTTREGAVAHIQGAALAPLYSEPAMRGFQRFMTRTPIPLEDAAGRLLRHRRLGGARGMFGSAGVQSPFMTSGPEMDARIDEIENMRIRW